MKQFLKYTKGNLIFNPNPNPKQFNKGLKSLQHQIVNKLRYSFSTLSKCKENHQTENLKEVLTLISCSRL